MILDLLYVILGSALQIVSFIFGTITFFIPPQINTAFSYLLGNLKYFEGVLPVYEILPVIEFLLDFMVVWYSIKLAIKIYSMLPFIGKKIHPGTPGKVV